jgi:protocatechuate 3,4-dioxygenase beta subunit
VLCGLEEKSLEEAARALGWSRGSVKWRLQRGRDLLRTRLRRRGLELPAALAATALALHSASGPVSAALVNATLRAASQVAAGGGVAAGAVSAEVAALVEGAGKTMPFGKLKLATVFLLVLTVGAAGLGLFTLGTPAAGPPGPERKEAAPPQAAEPKSDEKAPVAVSGRVLDPDGKPVAGARLHQGPAQRAVSDEHGQFRFTAPSSDFPMQVVGAADGFGLGWVQVAKPQGAGELTIKLVKDVPIAGHIIDPEGRPVAGATVRLIVLAATPEEDLSAWLKAVEKRKANSLFDGDHFKNALVERVPGLPQTVTTDEAGRFRLAGIGRERLVIASVGTPKFQFDMLGIMTRPAAGFQVTDEWKLTQNVYGASFDHVIAPSRAITGTVRDQDTGKPIGGVQVVPEGAREYGSPDATTDTDGKYRIDSLPGYYNQQRAPNVGGPFLMAFPPRNEPYLRSMRGIHLDAPRGEPLTVDFTMKRGIWVTVKVTNKATGLPVAGANVEYYPFRNNPQTADLKDASFGWMAHLDPHRTGPDGTARVPALPGPGLVGAGADDSTAFLRVEPLPDAANVFSDIFRFGDMLNAVQGIVRIDPEKEAKSPTYEVVLDPGRALTAAITGPDGQLLTGCRLFNAVPNSWGSWSKEPLAGCDFTLNHLPLGKPYTLIVLHPEKKLVRLLELKGDEKGPLSVKLEPAGTVTGRLLDPDGKPRPRTSLTVDFELNTGGGLLPHFPAEVTTDAEGRFRIEGLAPGTPYFVLLGGPPKFVGEVKRLKLRPGESRDLGEVKYEPLPQ